MRFSKTRSLILVLVGFALGHAVAVQMAGFLVNLAARRNPVPLAERARPASVGTSEVLVTQQAQAERTSEPAPESPLDAAMRALDRIGLQPGDVITSVNGYAVDSPSDALGRLQQLIQTREPLREVVVLRAGKPAKLSLASP